MVVGEYVALGSFCVTILALVGGLAVRVTKAIDECRSSGAKELVVVKKEFSDKLAHAEVENDLRRKRIYERLDEERKEVERRFMSKEVHQVLYDTLHNDLAEIKKDVKKLLSRNGFKHED